MRVLENNKVKSYIFAIFFIKVGLINLIISIVSNMFNLNETSTMAIVRYVVYGIILIFIFFEFLKKVKETSCSMTLKIILIFLPFIFVVPEMYNCAITFFDINAVIYFAKFVAFVLPVYFIAVCITLGNKKIDIEFIRCFKYISLLLTPFFLYYLIRMTFPADPMVNYSDFGYMNYMSMAYFMLPLFLGTTIELLLLSNNRKEKVLALYGSIITLISIICTGTRGVIIVTVCMILLVLLYSIIYRTIMVKKVLIFTVFIIVVNLFAQYVWQPTGSRLGKQFIDDPIYAEKIEDKEVGFLPEISERQNHSPEFIEAQYIILSYAVNNSITYEESVEKALNEIKDNNYKEVYQNEISEGVLNELKKIDKEDLTKLSRIPLMQIALMEFNYNDSKLFGNGFYYYINKYGTYPHNAILELLCDTGIVGVIVFVCIVIAILFLIRRQLKYKEVAAIMIFALSYTPSYLVSGSVYMDEMIHFFITVGVIYIYNLRVENKIE